MPAQSSGRDRRTHHRREAERVWAEIDGGWYKVRDLSLGGLSLDRPVERPDVGDTLDGTLHSRAADRQRQSTFRATVVRVDDEGQRVAAAFTPMEAEQIDGLIAILSAIEREFVDARAAELRREAFHRRLRRILLISAAAALAFAAGYAAWLAR